MMGRKIETAPTQKNGTTKTLNSSGSSTTMTFKYIKNEDGEFVCPHPGCGFTKRNQSTLHYHMKKHAEQLEYVCKTCKKQFLQKQTLDLHIRSKHPDLIKDDEEDKKFKCPFNDCEFSALTKGNCIIHCLRVHFQDEINEMMLKDNETKTIYCNECNKAFSSSSAFMYHCKNCITFDKNSYKYKAFQEIVA
jgi:DNA-directed RNA polymerase subunit RPC12/RpoP